MFYEKLAELKQEKKRGGAEDPEKSVLRGLGGAAGALVGSRLGRTGAGKLYNYEIARIRRPDEADHLRRLHKKINPEVAQVISEESIPELTKNAPFFDVSTRPELRNFVDGGAAFTPNIAVDTDTGQLAATVQRGGKVKTRGMISSGLKNSDSSALMHELGHATGKLGYGKHKAYDAILGKSAQLTRGAPGHLLTRGGPGHFFGLGRAAVDSFNIGRAKTQKDLDRIERRTNIGTALHGLAAAPLLFEEGRANMRAIGLGKKLGANVSKRKLGAGFGTYLANAAGQTLVPHYLLKAQLKRRRKALGSEE